MEGIKVGVGVGVGAVGNGNGNADDTADGMQICSNHPYRNNNANPGGICAFCLQEKLGKLVSSSFPLPLRASPSSSSSSPSFRSDTGSKLAAGKGDDAKEDEARRGRTPFLLAKKKKKNHDDRIIFSRSRSTVTHRGSKFFDGFWSFLYLSSKPHASKPAPAPAVAASDDGSINGTTTITTIATAAKVSRSRSVGCGSRSFSGDFFERISTGFGDCTLRRVESQREGKPPTMKERVKCGGIFGGFMIMTSSSSSSSSSSYRVSSATEDHVNGKPPPPPTTGHGGLVHGRSKSWGWAFASPMRAFTKPSSNKKHNSNNNTTPNLSAIPSLLSVTN
ncbi:hypothetical protein V6N11_046600 [Hibiscus sabdariffa]|uniref:Uncharacterized protein n=2 Tax=Hibiscus sabdariffa TaxID=183260 RepID=A0ABR2P2P4_9ROSI